MIRLCTRPGTWCLQSPKDLERYPFRDSRGILLLVDLSFFSFTLPPRYAAKSLSQIRPHPEKSKNFPQSIPKTKEVTRDLPSVFRSKCSKV